MARFFNPKTYNPNNMKKKIIIKVPKDVEYLTDWYDFDSTLPQGKVVLDKGICGCGCTEYYLRNNLPVILVSPRKELIHSKVISDRNIPLFYFDRSNKKIKAEETIEGLVNYIHNPFKEDGFVPKILVTYDSLKLVINTLLKQGCLDRFVIVIDEFPCIFTDVMLKGFLELNLIHMLNQLQNHIVFISATPIKEVYLDELDEFKNIPYVSLIWDKRRYESVRVTWQKMISTKSAIKDIIERYRNDGFFMAKKDEGYYVYSREAVFFLNSVNEIVHIISACKLTPDNTLVICADDQKNRDVLSKVGFTIGHIPGRSEYKSKNKTFTFVTKASFEGADFYSDNSTTYIFADSNKDHLALDISIDLPQIIGRCRSKENPFRGIVNYYYKTTAMDNFDIDVEKSRISNKVSETDRLVELCESKGITDYALLRKISTLQAIHRYKDDYLEMQVQLDGTAKAVFNRLAYVAELRAIEIKSMQYRSTDSVMAYLEENGYTMENYYCTTDDAMAMFYREFMQDKNFQRRMKLYVETVGENIDLKKRIEANPDIPMKYKDFYNTLGAEKIKSLSYKEANLENQIKLLQSKENIRKHILRHVGHGQQYSNQEIKAIMENAFTELNIKQAAVASRISDYISAEKCRFTDGNGTRQRGYKIL